MSIDGIKVFNVDVRRCEGEPLLYLSREASLMAYSYLLTEFVRKTASDAVPSLKESPLEATQGSSLADSIFARLRQVS